MLNKTQVDQSAPQTHIRSSLEEASTALQQLLNSPNTLTGIEAAAETLVKAFGGGHRVFSCGNGGSMCDAIHFAEELSGKFRLHRSALPATAISDPGHLSCVSNDYGYEQVFSRYLEAHARPGDVLLGISTSGTSKNVLRAARFARQEGLSVISLTGKPGTPIGQLADIDISTPGGTFADRVQELHIKVIHILIELVERHLFPDNYPPALNVQHSPPEQRTK